MKITFVTPTLAVHGGTLVLARYAQAAKAAGHTVTIISLGQTQPDGWNDHGEIILAPSKTRRLLDFATVQVRHRRTLAQAIPADSDWIIPIYGPLIPAAIQAKKQAVAKQRTAQLSTNHTAPQATQPKVLWLGQDSLEIPLTGAYLKRLLPRVSPDLDGVMAVSQPLADQYEKLLHQPVTVIPNGLDHHLFYPKATPKEPFLLFVGRPNYAKGFSTFRRAVHFVRQQHPEVYGLVIAPGLKPRQQNGVHYQPFTTREALAQAFRQATAYVSASRAESFGLPPLEAMASGTAVVLTNTTGSRDYAINEENCLVVPVGQPKAMATAITRLIDDSQLRHTLETNGPATAARYTWATAEAAFLHLLETKE